MARRLIVLYDGTGRGGAEETCPTNVARLKDCIAPLDDKANEQETLFVRGIGAKERVEGARDKLFQPAKRIFDFFQQGTGAGITGNVLTGYAFLSQNFDPGDEIYLFGFSRGAHTARALAGLIGTHGLMSRSDNRLDERDGIVAVLQTIISHRRGEATEIVGDGQGGVRVKCVGVFDTVASVGVPQRIRAFSEINDNIFQFYDTEIGGHIDYGIHAMAIDEKRARFPVTPWTGPLPAGTKQVEQAWFAGVHSDIGGGYDEDGLSNLTLNWMIDRVSQIGLKIKSEVKPGNFRGLLHESSNGFFSLNRIWPATRKLGEPHLDQPILCEHLHQSAIDRYQCGEELDVEVARFLGASREQVRYQPANLKAAMDRLKATA